MAEAARAGAAPLLAGLPDEVVVWEILILLDPNSLLRCRAVARAWRRAASTRRLLLAHHARQPNLPIIDGSHSAPFSVRDIIPVPFDIRAADLLQPVARFHPMFSIKASCDGLLVLSVYLSEEHTSFAICNPATRQYAPLPTLSGFIFLGMYPHSPTGEYRLLLYKRQLLWPTAGDGSYVFSIGSGQPPRLIGWPTRDADLLVCAPPSVVFRGNLHWHLTRPETAESASSLIMVFDTTAESFRQMRAPDALYRVALFEADGMLSLSNLTHTATSVDIWLMQDYETEVWALKYRVEFQIHNIWEYLAAPWDGGVLVLLKPGDFLIQIDIDGKLVTVFHQSGLHPTAHRLKQSLVSHAFFPTLEGYAVNAWPFMTAFY